MNHIHVEIDQFVVDLLTRVAPRKDMSDFYSIFDPEKETIVQALIETGNSVNTLKGKKQLASLFREHVGLIGGSFNEARIAADVFYRLGPIIDAFE